MGSLQQPVETRPAASAELSLDISRVVSRVMNGEAVDTAATADDLAAKYPMLGMTGAMIEEAISRAAGMVGMIRGVPIAAEEAPVPEASPANGVASDALEGAFSTVDFSPAMSAGGDDRVNGDRGNLVDELEMHEGGATPNGGFSNPNGSILAKGASVFRAFFRR